MSPAAKWLLETAIVAAGAAVQGSVGFGLNLVAVPLLTLVDPSLVPGPVLVAALFLTLLVFIRERRGVDLKGLGWALLGRIPGTVAGIGALLVIPADRLALVFASLVLLAVAISASGVRLRRSRGAMFVAGALSGFMSTTSAVGGPPMALVYQESPGPTLRGTLSGYFIVGATISLFALALAGRFTRADALHSVALLPGIAFGFLVSRKGAELLDRGFLRPAVLALATLASLAVIAREMCDW